MSSAASGSPPDLVTCPHGYDVRLQSVPIAGGEALAIRSLRDTQQYFDPEGLAEAAGISPACWSLFGQIWPAARCMADRMQTCLPTGGRVLEMGCGLALASLVLHRRGFDVTASDCHPLTELFLKVNLGLNALPAMDYRIGNWGRENLALGSFDLLIGSDILYERNHPETLAGFIDRHASPDAQILILDPNRSNRSAFIRCLGARGFAYREEKVVWSDTFHAVRRGHWLNFWRGH